MKVKRTMTAREERAWEKDPMKSFPRADRSHGRMTEYEWWGCRCDECREAASVVRKERRG